MAVTAAPTETESEEATAGGPGRGGGGSSNDDDGGNIDSSSASRARLKLISWYAGRESSALAKELYGAEVGQHATPDEVRSQCPLLILQHKPAIPVLFFLSVLFCCVSSRSNRCVVMPSMIHVFGRAACAQIRLCVRARPVGAAGGSFNTSRGITIYCTVHDAYPIFLS